MCLARTHAVSTSVIAFATATCLSSILGHQPTGAELALYGACSGGYGIIADLDHPQATASRILGPVTQSMAVVINRVSGGHRKGTHTVWAAALMVGLVSVSTLLWGQIVSLAFMFIGLFFAIKLLPFKKYLLSGSGELGTALLAVILTAVAWFYVPDWGFLPWAAGVGILGHMFGDMLTTEGIYPFWGIPKIGHIHLRVPLLGRTGGFMESVVFYGACVVALVWLIACAATGHNFTDVTWVTAHAHQIATAGAAQ